MSEYGLKIKNFEAGSLYGYNLGVRDRLDSTDAMFTNLGALIPVVGGVLIFAFTYRIIRRIIGKGQNGKAGI